jgi:hypothetical protein
MSAHAVVWLLIGIALVIVLAMTGAQVVRALREVGRLGDRVDAFADLPVLKKLDRVEADVGRIEAAIAQVGPLVERTQAAIAVIRRGPIPPQLIDAIRRVRTEIADFRSAAQR